MKTLTKMFLIGIFTLTSGLSVAQKSYQAASIAFYNVENLYDTIPSADVINGNLPETDPNYQVSISIDSANALNLPDNKGKLTFDNLKGKHVIRRQILTDEFSYNGTKLWNSKKYNEKIKNLAKVLTEIGFSDVKSTPSVIGLCEVENDVVLNDLANAMKNKSGVEYGIVHYNSFDARGVDTGLLYNKKRFIPSSSKRLIVKLYDDATGNRYYTRDILMVGGQLDGEKFYFFVNHWPSRRGGEQASRPNRIKAAEVLKQAMDSIQNSEPNAKLFVMGDFNDDPNNFAIKKTLGTVSKKDQASKEKFFNAAEELFKKGIGTLAYQDSFNFFDQQIMSANLANNKNKETYFFHKMNVFSPNYLVSQEGPFKGYPFRSFSGNNYTGGYSDHFPVYTVLLKEVKK